ncbi:tetratricopeptide repeat protein [Streptomyces aureocirculatus]|uniref:tetratricopeptide repeat protein n=1 Tax=Streptomyces aureocirculatus TaxID=67275 RepID=UPI0012FF2C74|nr:tetratricopeptide repeat protein [Streptomyces aureocirculatus]
MRWLTGGRVRRPVLELYGAPGAGTYAAASRLLRHAEIRAFDVLRVPVLRSDVAPELTLLRLLEALGEAPEPLIGTVSAAPDVLVPMLTALCREQLRAGRCHVVVLHGVPAGEPGATLLRLIARTLHGTDTRVLATTASRHTGTGLRLISRRVHPFGEDAVRPVPARDRLRAPAAALLDVLTRWAGEEFTVPVASALRGTGCRTAVGELYTGGLLQQTRAGRYRLHPAAVAEARPAERTDAGAALDRELAAAVLEGRADLRDGPDAYADLAVRLLCAHEPQATALLRELEPHLAGRHGMFRLLRMKQSLWHLTGDYEPVRLLAAVSTRETGNPTTASRVLKPSPSPRAALEEAVTRRHLGRLAAAAITLDGIPARTPDGWVLHTQAALQCDMGTLTGVDRLLRRAVEAHQVRGDRRGEAWAVHHYGRLRLLRGDTEEARKRLEAARHTFAGLGDLHGVAWSSTELARVALFDGAHEEAIEALTRARDLHRRNHDVRGATWALLYTGFAEAEALDFESAREHVAQAFMEFWGIPDRLGAAWAQHCLGLLPGLARTASPDAAFFLRRAHTDFVATGCPHGQAWSALELAELGRRRDPAGDRRDRRYLDASRLFAAMDDAAGERWARTSYDRGGPTGLAFARRRSLGLKGDLERFYPPHVLRAYVEWPDGPIPLAARYTVPEPGAHPDSGAPPSLSRVRLVLLDDEATTSAAARIALRVDPGPDHPWSTRAADLPWLTARATPLTAADVEPTHAVTLKPSPRDPDGAEFLFTPRRAGRHRLLFTIEHSATATVLQQVETYIDVTDGGGGSPTATLSPEALRRA